MSKLRKLSGTRDQGPLLAKFRGTVIYHNSLPTYLA